MVKARPQGSYTIEEVKLHNREGDLWVVVKNEVYDLTSFANEHPGGKKSMFAFPSLPLPSHHLPSSVIILLHCCHISSPRMDSDVMDTGDMRGQQS